MSICGLSPYPTEPMSNPSPTPSPPQQLPLAIGYMMIMGAVWGLQISLAKVGSQHQIDPVAWMVFVNAVGAPALLLIAALRGTNPLCRCRTPAMQ